MRLYFANFKMIAKQEKQLNFDWKLKLFTRWRNHFLYKKAAKKCKWLVEEINKMQDNSIIQKVFFAFKYNAINNHKEKMELQIKNWDLVTLSETLNSNVFKLNQRLLYNGWNVIWTQVNRHIFCYFNKWRAASLHQAQPNLSWLLQSIDYRINIKIMSINFYKLKNHIFAHSRESIKSKNEELIEIQNILNSDNQDRKKIIKSQLKIWETKCDVVMKKVITKIFITIPQKIAFKKWKLSCQIMKIVRFLFIFIIETSRSITFKFEIVLLKQRNEIIIYENIAKEETQK